MHRQDPREIIRTLMDRRGIASEAALAALANIDQSTLHRYLKGETEWLNSRTLQALAGCLQVTSSQLLGEVALDADPRTTAVVLAMESLPDNLKDALVAASKSLLDSQKPKPH